MGEVIYDLSKARKVKTRGKGTGNAVLNNGKVTVDAIKSNPTAFKGKSTDEVARMLKNEGYDVTVKDSTKSSSGAKIRWETRRGSPYVKISTNDESAYKTDGKETATIIFTGG
ncbi:hypothetical protein [Shouchella clausii]|uniref:hypothetical protein n=1 Tax=Shouchella clausii TaxID=79880 RepID=UPI0027018FB9|nr:hypothetical protein [Shouchella clausii]MDO7270240.1 hypothetical protein [Shouchella clausii]MDO7289995.1 hypothetical protein [Shouchella clausii]